MKNFLFFIMIFAILALFSGIISAQEKRSRDEENESTSNKMFLRYNSFRMMGTDNGNHFSGSMMMGGYGLREGYFNPDLFTIIENYRIKIQKIYLDAGQSKISLDTKRIDLYIRLNEFAEKYKSDKTLTNDVINTIKDLNAIQNQIHGIDQDAMKKIETLIISREKEIEAANDAWIKKLAKDDKELENYLEYINLRSRRMLLFTNSSPENH